MSVGVGIVEGLAGFLPVGSTAQRRIAEYLLNISLQSGYWKMYPIVVQIGAIATLPIYFREHIHRLFSTFPRGERGDRTMLTHPLSLVMIAFVITALPSYLLTKVIGKNLESLYVMGAALVVGGAVMWLGDWIRAKAEGAGEAAGPNSRIHTWRMDDMSLGQAMWIGACQILSAVFPGTSRSMSTITAGQVAGMSRAAAPGIFFFFSLPPMAMAVAYSLFKSLRGKDENPIGVAQIDAHQWIVLLIGLVVSFVVAYGAVAWFMGWVRKRGFAAFAVYRIILGAVVLYYATRIAG